MGLAQTKNNLHTWGYKTGAIECECSSKQTDQHILICPLNLVTSTPSDITNATDAAINLAKQWSIKGILWQAL